MASAPHEVADLIADLASARAAAIHGAEFVIDGGTVPAVDPRGPSALALFRRWR
ncbi:MAG: hypothetical protein AB1592_01825 [Pseudomonadota bacterium]